MSQKTHDKKKKDSLRIKGRDIATLLGAFFAGTVAAEAEPESPASVLSKVDMLVVDELSFDRDNAEAEVNDAAPASAESVSSTQRAKADFDEAVDGQKAGSSDSSSLMEDLGGRYKSDGAEVNVDAQSIALSFAEKSKFIFPETGQGQAVHVESPVAIDTDVNSGPEDLVFEPLPELQVEVPGIEGFDTFYILGDAQGERAGIQATGIGDINGDGYADMIVGAPLDSSLQKKGEAYVVFGRPDGYSEGILPESLDGTNGFVVQGVQNWSNLGEGVSAAGDMNGDGINDFMIAAPSADVGNTSMAGSVYVIFGDVGGFDASLDLSALDGTNGFRIDGTLSRDQVGNHGQMNVLGDVNGDGYSDIAIGRGDPEVQNPEGSVYVVYGNGAGFDASMNVEDLDGSNGFSIDDIEGFETWGGSISGVGDFNGDGFDDFMVGIPMADSQGGQGFGSDYAGKSYLIYGSNQTLDPSNSIENLDGFEISGAQEWGLLGSSVSGLGDVNGDGLNDFVISAPLASTDVAEYSGASYVIFGDDSGTIGNSFDLATLDGENGFVIAGGEYAYAGVSVSNAGDFNGDGFDDIAVADDYQNVYVVFGKEEGFSDTIDLSDESSMDFVSLGVIDEFNYGLTLEAAGDINNDGYDDLVIGVPGGDLVDNNAGYAVVVFGGSPDPVGAIGLDEQQDSDLFGG